MGSLLYNVALLVVIVNASLTVGASVSNSSRFDVMEDGPNSTLGNGSRGNSSLADGGSSWYASFHVSNLWEYGNWSPFGPADIDESNATLTVPEVPRNNSLHLTNFLLANESSSSLNPWNTTFHGFSYLLRSNETLNGTASNRTVPESRSLTNVNSWDWNVDLNNTNGSRNSSSVSDGNFKTDGFSNVNSWSWNVVLNNTNGSLNSSSLSDINFTTDGFTNVNSWSWNVVLNNTNGSSNSSSMSDGNFNTDGFSNDNSWSWNVVAESNSFNSTFDIKHFNLNVLGELNSSTTASENGTEGGTESDHIRQHWRFDVVEESNSSVATVKNNTKETNLSDNFHLFHHLEFDVVEASNGSNAVENEPDTVFEKNQSSHTNFSLNATEDIETLPDGSASLFKTNLHVVAESAVANFTKPGSSQNTTSANETSTSTNGTIEDLRADATPDPDSLLLLLNTDPPFAVRFPDFNEDSHEARENDTNSNRTTSSWLRPWASWFADPETTSFNWPLSNVSEVDESNHNGSSNKNQTGNLAAEIPSTGSFWGVGNTFKSFHPWVNWFAGVTTTEIPSEEVEANETASPALNVSIRDFRAFSLSEQVGAPNANGSQINQNSDPNSTLGFDDHIHDENCDHALDFFDNDTLAVSIEEVDSIEREQRSSFESVDYSTRNNSLVSSNGDDQRKFFPNFAVVNLSGPVPTPFIVEESMIMNATNLDTNADNSTGVFVKRIPDEETIHESTKPVFESSREVPKTETGETATSSRPVAELPQPRKPVPNPDSPEQIKPHSISATSQPAPLVFKPKPSKETSWIPKHNRNEGPGNQQPGMDVPLFVKPLSVENKHHSHSHQSHGVESDDSEEEHRHQYHHVSEIQQPGMSVPVFKQLNTQRLPASSADCPTELSEQPCPEWLTVKNPQCDSDDDCQVDFSESKCCLLNCRRRCVDIGPGSEPHDRE